MVLTARFLNLSAPRQSSVESSDLTECDDLPSDSVRTKVQAQRRLDPDSIQALVSDYLSGQSVRQLTETWDIHRTTVLDHLERNNIPRRPTVRKLTDTQLKEAADLYRAGNPLKTLGAKYSVDPQTVSRELKKVGVQIRPPGRWG